MSNNIQINSMVVIAVESAVKYSFVLNGMQKRREGQYNAKLTLWPCLRVKPLITARTAILNVAGILASVNRKPCLCIKLCSHPRLKRHVPVTIELKIQTSPLLL